MAAAAGAYVFHSNQTITTTQTYVDDFRPWNEGDVRQNVSRSHFTAATPGGEGSIGLVYRLGPSISLGLIGRLILISKTEDTDEYADYYKPEWDPAESRLSTMKYGEEYGGIAWGVGATLMF